MVPVRILLERFKRLTRPNILVREKTSVIIQEEVSVKIDDKKIFLRNGVIYVDTHDPIVKSEIFLKKRKILGRIQEELGERGVFDIK